jgi:RNA polymerase sigma-70 factor (ECF subfamily)
LTDAAEITVAVARTSPGANDAEQSAAAAFEASLEALLADGYRVALAILRQPQEAEDAVQEAAGNAWSKREQLRAADAIRPWFLAIVTNTCRMRLRSTWWRRGRATGSELALDQVEGPRHEGAVEWSADLERALRGLSWNQRAVISLYYQLDMPQEEVARVLQVRVGTVKSRLSRATAALRSAVVEEDYRR